MILVSLAIITFLVVIGIIFTDSHKSFKTISIIHGLAYFGVALFIAFTEKIPQYFTANSYFFIDSLGVLQILIATFVFALAAIYLGDYVDGMLECGELDKSVLKIFYIAFNLLLIVTVFAFLVNNLALFWIFAELTTFFSALLIATLNSKENISAAVKYVFITSIAMLFSFIGLIILFAASKQLLGHGSLNIDVLMANAGAMNSSLLIIAFILTFIGFAAKAGIAPFHTWLPHAHSKAPSAVSAILSAVILNVGIYGILRISMIIRPTAAFSVASKILIIFGVLTLVIAAFSMLKQSNLKKMIAFSSIEHMGLMLIGIGIGTPLMIFWVLFHMVAHSLTKSLLFFSAGIINRQYHNKEPEAITKALVLQPLASWGMILGSAAIIGLPPFAIFISKFFMLSQIAQQSFWLFVIVLFLLFLAASAVIVFMIKLFSNGVEHKKENKVVCFKAGIGMKIPIIILLVVICLLGLVFPAWLTKILDAIVASFGL